MIKQQNHYRKFWFGKGFISCLTLFPAFFLNIWAGDSNPGKKYALVVGINKYTINPLEFAVADAESVGGRLQELDFEVTFLLDEKATLEGIRNELGTRFKRLVPEDQLLVYFAGHGVTEEVEKEVVGYLCPINFDDSSPYATGLPMAELKEVTSRIPAKHVLFVLDCCFSGLGLARGVRPMNEVPNVVASLAGDRVVYAITAGTKDQVALEAGGHGVFTQYFLAGIAGAADRSPLDGKVFSSELGIYLNEMVSLETGTAQTPMHGRLKGKGDFVFPLQSKDPQRLLEMNLVSNRLTLARLQKRKSLQGRYHSQVDILNETEKALNDSLAQSSRELSRIGKEIAKLEEETGHDRTQTQQADISVLKFFNTQKEVDTQKTFSSVLTAGAYFKEVLGLTGLRATGKQLRSLSKRSLLDQALQNQDAGSNNKATNLPVLVSVDLLGLFEASSEKFAEISTELAKKNPYLPEDVKNFDSRCWPLFGKPFRLRQNSIFLEGNLSLFNFETLPFKNSVIEKRKTYTVCFFEEGPVDLIEIKLFCPASIMDHMTESTSELVHDTTTFIQLLRFTLYSPEEQSVNFPILRERMVAHYGATTGRGKTFQLFNFHNRKVEQYSQLYWEDETTRLTLLGGSRPDNFIEIRLENKNPIFAKYNERSWIVCRDLQRGLLLKRTKAFRKKQGENSEDIKF